MYQPSFEADLAELGVSARHWDEVAVLVDEILCGAELSVLDREFPPLVGTLRLIVTEPTGMVPAFRVAWSIKPADPVAGESELVVYEHIGIGHMPETVDEFLLLGR